MNVSEYIEWSLIDSGSTVTEFELAEIFKINQNDFSSMEEFSKAILKKQEISNFKLTGGTFMVGDKKWIYDEDLSKTSIGQWSKMHQILAETEGMIDVRLVALYIRPFGEVYDSARVEDIGNQIYDFPAEVFIALNNFFFHNAIVLLDYMKVYYLNQANQVLRQERIESGRLFRGKSYLKALVKKIFSNSKNYEKQI